MSPSAKLLAQWATHLGLEARRVETRCSVSYVSVIYYHLNSGKGAGGLEGLVKCVNEIEYTFDLQEPSSLDIALRCFKDYGFCAVEGAVSQSNLSSAREEVLRATKLQTENIRQIEKRLRDGFSDSELLRDPAVHVRLSDRINHPVKPVNELIWMPVIQQALCSTAFLRPLRALFGPHFTLHQLHSKLVPGGIGVRKDAELGNDRFGMPRVYSGPDYFRDWHCDWPHDPMAYGGGNAEENVGFIPGELAHTFCAVTALLYLDNCEERSGGTIVVPGSHLDERKPRDPSSPINVAAPIDGELRIKAGAGTVLLIDTRLWHTAPFCNESADHRVAVVSRWAPWWLNTSSYASHSRFNRANRPINFTEWSAFPDGLKPHTRNLCSEIHDQIHRDLLEVSKAAAEQTRQQLASMNIENVSANSHLN